METRKILSFVLALAMLMSTVVCHAASEPTEYYQLATHKTTGGGNYLEVDLDKIFITGETYKIALNVKPDELTGVPVNISLADSNTAALRFGLLYLYENGAHALGGSNYSYGGGMSGFKDSILANGIDMEMSWNTATGNVDIDIWYAHGTAWPTAEHKTFTYAAGVITEGQKYGKLKIGGENSAVTVTGLEIKNVNAPEPEPEPSGTYHLDSYTTETGENLSVNLDDVLVNGMTYEISFNMKPSTIDVSVGNDRALRAGISGGDVPITNSNGQDFGFFNLYTENGKSNIYYHELGAWKGNLNDYLDKILSDGIDIKLIWNTEEGSAAITATIGADWSSTFSWNPGKVTGKYGNLTVGAAGSTVTITDLNIGLPNDYETVKPVIKSEYIKFTKCDNTVKDFSAMVSASTKDITVSFPVEMLPHTLTADSVILKNEDTGKTVKYTVEKDVNSYKMLLNNLLEPKSNYSLTFGETVSNVLGEKLGTPVSFNFATDDGEFNVSIKGVSLGENDVPTIAQIVAGSNMKTNINIENSTGNSKNCLLILTYYNGKELKKAEYVNVAVGADEKYKIKDITSSIKAPSDCDSLHIFLWDGIKTMLSYDNEFVIQ